MSSPTTFLILTVAILVFQSCNAVLLNNTNTLSSIKSETSMIDCSVGQNPDKAFLNKKFQKYENLAKNPIILLSLLAGMLPGLLFVVIPILIFADVKRKIFHLIKKKKSSF